MTCWSSKTEFSEWLTKAALAAGALDAACLHPGSLDNNVLEETFEDWLAEGNADRLAYMTRTAAERKAPFAARPWARNAIVVTFRGDWGNTAADWDLKPADKGQLAGYVSAYACGTDYHRVGHGILRSIADQLQTALGYQIQTEACVDTRPAPEVYFAVKGGLGIRGLNRLLRTAEHGSRVFAGVLFTGMDLPEVRHQPHPPALPCTQCRACIQRCPTQALDEDRPIRVDRCRSYLSMEYRGPLSAQQQTWLGNALFGCDICTAACPPKTHGPTYGVDLDWLLRASRGEVRKCLAHSALNYAGVTLLRRNAVAILRNDGSSAAQSLLETVRHKSASPVIQQTIRQATPNSPA